MVMQSFILKYELRHYTLEGYMVLISQTDGDAKQPRFWFTSSQREESCLDGSQIPLNYILDNQAKGIN